MTDWNEMHVPPPLPSSKRSSRLPAYKLKLALERWHNDVMQLSNNDTYYTTFQTKLGVHADVWLLA
jgi:hypothetical protein